MTLHEITNNFRAAMIARGIDPPEVINPDAKSMQRFHVEGDKPGTKNGFYNIHTDNIPAGTFGSWKINNGTPYIWCSKSPSEMTPAEQRSYLAKIKKQKEQHEQEKKQLHIEAAKYAKNRFDIAHKGISHAYLEKKKVCTHNLRVDYHKGDIQKPTLLIPLVDTQGTIHSLQCIYWSAIENKFVKRFLKGGEIKGHFHPIGTLQGASIILIAEGFASGESLHAATDLPIACALSSNNLEPVAINIKKEYPEAKVIICGDNDLWPDKKGKIDNVGQRAATHAANAVGGSLLIPDFRNCGLTNQLLTEKQPTDFNDIVSLLIDDKSKALAEIKRQVDACIAANKSKTRLAAGYCLMDDGVYYSQPGQDTDNPPILVCSPLQITAYFRDSHSTNWGLLLEFKDPAGNLHKWGMANDMLSGSGEVVLSQLLNRGLRLGSSKKRLLDYLGFSKPSIFARGVSKTGWHEVNGKRVFVALGDVIYGSSPEQIVQQTERPFPPLKSCGDLPSWQNNVSRYCQENSRLLFAVSTAFAAPLLEIARIENGGFHLFQHSSIGKTIALKIAGSVYSDKSYLTRWRSIINGLEAQASVHNDCLLTLDELAQIDPREAGNSIYMLGNGTGKNRANSYGNARQRHEWRILFLSSGEIPLDQHIQEGGQRATAGQSVRCIDIPADAGAGYGLFEMLHDFSSSAEFAHHLETAIEEYYGTAFPAFMEKLLEQDLNKVKIETKEMGDRFLKEHIKPNSDGQVHRVAAKFALVAYAGELATEMGITAWDTGQALWAASQCFKAWISHRGGVGSGEKQALLNQVKAIFDRYGNSRFQRSHDDKITDRLGYINDSGEFTGKFLLSSTGFKKIHEGFDRSFAIKTLEKSGWLLSGKQSQSIHITALNKNERVYIFDNNYHLEEE